jgi:hypothetical protein
MIEVIKEYVIKNQICTTAENIKALQDYFTENGFDSVGLVFAALDADRKVVEILTSK